MVSTYPGIGSIQLPEFELSKFYGEVEEPIPPNAPEAIGKAIDFHVFVNSDHTGDKHMSFTGFLMYLYTHKSAGILIQCRIHIHEEDIECLQDISSTLHVMGIPIDYVPHSYGDGISVMSNTSKPKSRLLKKNKTVCYITICKYVTMREFLTAHIYGNENPAQLLTKVIHRGKRSHLVNNF